MRIRKLTCLKCRKVHEIQTVSALSNHDWEYQFLLDGSLYALQCDACLTMNYFDYPLIIEHDGFVVAYKKDDPADRTVNNQNDLIEKVNILDHQLDDRVIEIMKYLMKKRVFDADVNPEIHFTQAKENLIEFRVVINKKFNFMTQSMSAYTSIRDRLGNNLDLWSGDSQVIDENWVKTHFETIEWLIQHKNKH